MFITWFTLRIEHCFSHYTLLVHATNLSIFEYLLICFQGKILPFFSHIPINLHLLSNPVRWFRKFLFLVVSAHLYVLFCEISMIQLICSPRYSQVAGKTFLYYFDHRSSVNPWPEWMGVMHGYEIEFVFGIPLDPSLGYTKNEVNMTKRFMKHWANFARTGYV